VSDMLISGILDYIVILIAVIFDTSYVVAGMFDD
jgi:hypothetical protein